ncbi:MAG: aryl-sulfate sulfotransferase [Planctomycetes bacterium]|nr:aryl-sulfate sulfotransferase [Planctomycetota bacterium]
MRTILHAVVAVPFVALLAASSAAQPAPPPDQPGRGAPPEAAAEQPLGLVLSTDEVAPGYVLYAPLLSTSTFLLDNAGEVVHEWPSAYGPGSEYLLDDGTLLRCARLVDPPRFHGGGIYGRIERLAPDGTVLWFYELANEQQVLHHDFEVLPNGNILAIVWEYVSPKDALAHGRDPRALGQDGLFADGLIEIRPTLPSGGEIVWEWHVWDHLVQDVSEHMPDYGQIAEHPGRFDVNGEHRDAPPPTADDLARAAELEEQMRALGYVGGSDDADAPKEDDPRKRPDFMHVNAVDYHADLDLILLSSPHLCEVWVIDHSTTTEQARGTSGGRRGHGGDILWRWGDPRRYGAGTDADQRFFYQHDPEWLDGSNAFAGPDPGAARVDDLRITVFNNGGQRPDGDWSSIDELVLPFDPVRGFVREPGKPFGPEQPVWTYSDKGTFLSPFISGAQRLPNGDTLVCEGISGRLFEVNRAGKVVWDYRNPVTGDVPAPKGTGGVPPLAVFRATRYGPEHPGIVALLGAK